MPKIEFVKLLEQVGLISPPDITQNNQIAQIEESKTGEDDEPYNRKDVFEAIKFVHSFDANYLSYIDFLEALVHLAFDFPWSEEQTLELIVLDLKLKFFIDKIAKHYQGIDRNFQELCDK